MLVSLLAKNKLYIRSIFQYYSISVIQGPMTAVPCLYIMRPLGRHLPVPLYASVWFPVGMRQFLALF